MGMTIDPIERAARALCACDGHDPDGASVSSCGDPYWMFYRSKACAVIAAIREPSEGIVKAGQKAAVVALHRDGGYRMQDIWTAQIDALLAEGE
jgi:hypothetical protein